MSLTEIEQLALVSQADGTVVQPIGGDKIKAGWRVLASADFPFSMNAAKYRQADAQIQVDSAMRSYNSTLNALNMAT